MSKISVGKKELLALGNAVTVVRAELDSHLLSPSATAGSIRSWTETLKGLESLIAKVTRVPEKKTSSDAALEWLEAGLAGSKKYAKFQGGKFEGLVGMARQKKVTQEQLALVGLWCDRAQWLESYDLGLLLGKWESWLARATMARKDLETPKANNTPAGFED